MFGFCSLLSFLFLYKLVEKEEEEQKEAERQARRDAKSMSMHGMSVNAGSNIDARPEEVLRLRREVANLKYLMQAREDSAAKRLQKVLSEVNSNFMFLLPYNIVLNPQFPYFFLLYADETKRRML